MTGSAPSKNEGRAGGLVDFLTTWWAIVFVFVVLGNIAAGSYLLTRWSPIAGGVLLFLVVTAWLAWKVESSDKRQRAGTAQPKPPRGCL